MMNMAMRNSVLDIWVDSVTMTDALAKVVEFVEDGDRLHTVFAVNPEKNFSVPKDRLLMESFRSADLLIPDGIGIVLAARFLCGARLERVPGCELMQHICELCAQKGYGIFIYGAGEAINQEAVRVLELTYPDISIVGRANGYLSDDAMPELVRKINDSRAQVLFLALGSPKQEQWIARYRGKLKHVRVCQGIGGTLDVVTGNVNRAPRIFCQLGLEWLYRLASEPKRLRRQMVLPLFALQVLKAKFNPHAGKVCSG